MSTEMSREQVIENYRKDRGKWVMPVQLVDMNVRFFVMNGEEETVLKSLEATTKEIRYGMKGTSVEQNNAQNQYLRAVSQISSIDFNNIAWAFDEEEILCVELHEKADRDFLPIPPEPTTVKV